MDDLKLAVKMVGKCDIGFIGIPKFKRLVCNKCKIIGLNYIRYELFVSFKLQGPGKAAKINRLLN